MKKYSPTTVVLWIIYLFLLLVLMPHTAWAFRQFEPGNSFAIIGQFTTADLVSYVGALAFECAIAVLTHKLAQHLEDTEKAAKRLTGFKKTYLRYGNAFFLGLVISTAVSSLANLAHAIQFGTSMKIFTEWGIPSGVYAVTFGGILPFVSLLFARVLSNVTETEAEDDPALIEANKRAAEAQRMTKEAIARVNTANLKYDEAVHRAEEAEARFEAAGDLMRALMSDDKRQRIIAVRKQWPQLPGASIAMMVDSSPSYVSEVIKENVA